MSRRSRFITDGPTVMATVMAMVTGIMMDVMSRRLARSMRLLMRRYISSAKVGTAIGIDDRRLPRSIEKSLLHAGFFVKNKMFLREA